ncbi:hypothetical protein [Brevibacillus parabrevis]|uniref:hypothetical protein n=1 Tax=Brevibacillus parabrevis TaxID=54914 RepID=UPI0012F484EE|nr:hypothetical protein [Brevibacillus parabrevis]
MDNPLSLNRYTYGHNNPLKFVDPSGHMPVWSLNLISGTYNSGVVADWEASMMVFGGNTALGNGKHPSVYTPLHEIAQINVAKKLYEMTGQEAELEKSLDTGETEFFGLLKKKYEADIVLGNEVWEVKPLNGEDPKPQLELYKKIGGLTEGKQLKPITGITVFDQIKMEITFPNKGECEC